MDMLRGHLDLVLLGILRDRPGHGYEVLTALRDRSDGALDMTEGAIYPALHRLEDRGLLASEWRVASGRRRRIYRLTPAGRRALTQQAGEWRRLASAVDAVLGPPSARSRLAAEAGATA